MPIENGPPSVTKTTEEHLALNRELFAERDLLVEQRKTLVANHDEQPSPKTEKELKRTEQLLERVTAKIVEANRGLVVNRVSRFTKKATPDQKDEYMAAGMAGLAEAVDSYEMAYDNFAAWAMRPVMRAVLDAVRKTEHQTLSARDFEKRVAVRNAFVQLEQEAGGIAPSHEEVAARAGVKPRQVERILLATSLQGIGETWGVKMAAKRSDSEFVDFVLADHLWFQRLKELLHDEAIDMLGIIVFLR
ncbi:MAG: sigma-70 family RNA polymerase sigma factor, partial [Acidimicrobiales bacterium]